MYDIRERPRIKLLMLFYSTKLYKVLHESKYALIEVNLYMFVINGISNELY